jgi:hypothetical protein
MYELGRIDAAILNYLRNHPNAQDTLEGITEWWLPNEQIQTQTTLVKEALCELVDQGLIIELTGRDSQVRYRLNERRLKEIEVTFKRHSS